MLARTWRVELGYIAACCGYRLAHGFPDADGEHEGGFAYGFAAVDVVFTVRFRPEIDF